MRKEMNEGFTLLEERLDRLIAHVDSFLKFHYTLHGIKGHETTDEPV